MINELDILSIIAKQAKKDVASLSRESQLEELDLQSIDVVEMVFAIEEKFDIQIPYSPSDQEAIGISLLSVGDIVEAVKKLVADQHLA